MAYGIRTQTRSRPELARDFPNGLEAALGPADRRLEVPGFRASSVSRRSGHSLPPSGRPPSRVQYAR
jgi:hypothetical protein